MDQHCSKYIVDNICETYLKHKKIKINTRHFHTFSTKFQPQQTPAWEAPPSLPAEVPWFPPYPILIPFDCENKTQTKMNMANISRPFLTKQVIRPSLSSICHIRKFLHAPHSPHQKRHPESSYRLLMQSAQRPEEKSHKKHEILCTL